MPLLDCGASPKCLNVLAEPCLVKTILRELENQNEGILTAPTITAQARAENTRQLLAYTRGFVEASAPWLRAIPKIAGGAD